MKINAALFANRPPDWEDKGDDGKYLWDAERKNAWCNERIDAARAKADRKKAQAA